MNRDWRSNLDSQAQVLSEPAMRESEARMTLRRQFIGSVAVALAVMAMTGLSAMRPAHGDSAAWTASHIAIVQKPTFAAPAEKLVALKQNRPAGEAGGRAEQ